MILDVSLRHAFPGLAITADFQAPPGVTALFGRSGSGKTTLVNAVAGLLRPDAGRIVLGDRVLFDSATGTHLPPHKRRAGYVFQDARLFPHLDVAQNLDYGRWASRAPRDPGTRARIIDMLGLGALLSRRPGGLSGGERQRVALGRALLSDPQILLMDEPLAALDTPRKAEILPYLERLRDETALPILYVSHALSEVARLATTLVVLDAGRVVRAGSATQMLSDPDAAPLLGVQEAGARITGRLLRHHSDGLTEVDTSGGPLLLPRTGGAPGDRLHIRIAASDIILSRTRPEGLSALNVLPVTVETLRRGAHAGVMVRLRSGQDALLSRVSARAADRLSLEPGSQLFAVIESVSVASGDIGGAAGPDPA